MYNINQSVGPILYFISILGCTSSKLVAVSVLKSLYLLYSINSLPLIVVVVITVPLYQYGRYIDKLLAVTMYAVFAFLVLRF